MKKTKKYIGIIIVLMVLALSMIGYKVFFNKDPEVDPEILRSRSYAQVEEGDEAIDGTDYVTFDAFYLRDLDGDGYAEKIRGTCREIGSEDTLYMELNVLTNGTLKDAKITINGNNFYFATALVKDSVISKDYVSDNTKEIVLNDVVNGTQKLIFGMTRSGVYDSSYTKADAIGTNINNYNVTDNNVVLTGIHVDDDGTETPITKTVTFSTDWHGETHTILDSQYTYQDYNINDTIDNEKGTLNLNFYVKNEEIERQLILSKNHVEGTLPLLNGYAPIKLICTNSNTNLVYNEETRAFSLDMTSTLNKDGSVTRSLSRETLFRLVAVYPIEAYDTVEENAVSLDIPIKSWYEGYNNKDISFANPYRSDVAEDIISVLYREPQGENARVDVKIGDRVYDKYLSTYKNIISKKLPLDIYNNLVDESLNNEDNYWVEWYISTGTQAIDAPILLKETDMSSDKFLDVDGNYIDTSNYIKTTGIYFSNPTWLLGEDGYINVYNDETGDLIHTFTKEDWGLYNSNNPYMYSEPINHVRVETSNVLKSNYLSIYHLKSIDDLKLTADYSSEEFKKLNKIHSYLSGYMIIDGKEFHLDDDINFADYEEPYSFATIGFDRTYITNQETIKNAKMTIKTDTEMYNSRAWQNGVFLIELPEEIIDVYVNRVVANNSNVEIVGVNVYRTETNIFIKIFTSNNIEESFELNIDLDLTANPDKATATRDIKLYSYNPANDNYHEKKRTEDIYDLNNNQIIDDYTAYSQCSLSIVAPSNLSTSQYANNYDNYNSIAIAPQKAIVDKLDNSRTADINVTLSNNYSGTISQIRIVGKIPYEGNTYILNQNDMGSEFNTTIVNTGIAVPKELEQYATIYYSEKDDVDAELSNELNGWTTSPENFENVKSYMIDLGDYIMPVNEKKIFTYQVNIPAGIDYNKVSYSNHAVFYNLDTDQGRLRTQTEPNKLGIMIAEKYDLQIQKYETSTAIPISQVTFGVRDNESNNSIVASTYSDGIAIIEDLYVEKEYTFSELIGNPNYGLNSEQVTFIAHIVDGQLQFEILEGSFKDIPVVENGTDTADGLVKVEFENEIKYNFELEKLDLDTVIPIEDIKFVLEGNNKKINLKTDSEGKLSISKLEPNVQYILREVEANGYYLKEDISFMLVRQDGELKINILSGNFDTAPVIVRENDTDIPTVKTQLKNEIVPKYNLKIVKYENDNPDKKLAGVVFQLDGPGKDGVRYTTDENGEIFIPDLYEYIYGKNTDGRYTLTEVYPADGYINPSSPIDFYAERNSSGSMEIYVTNSYYCNYLAEYSVVDPSTEVPTVEFKVENNPVFTLKKIDSETGEPIEGAGFTIVDEYGYSVEDSQGNKVGNDIVYPGTLSFTSPENQSYPWVQDENGNWISTNAGVRYSKGYIISNEFNIDEDDVSLCLDAYIDTVSYRDYLVVELINSDTEKVIKKDYFNDYDENILVDIPRGDGYQIRIWFAKDYEDTEAPNVNSYSDSLDITSFYDGVILERAYFVKEDVLLTDENGEINLNLESGFYTMWEVMPKEGYELSTEKYTFGIDKSQVDQYDLSTIFQNEDLNLGTQEKIDMISDTEFVACTSKGYISRYSIADNEAQLIWRKKYSDRSFTNIAYANDAIYATNSGNTFMKLDLDGNVLWTKNIGVYCSSNLFKEVDDGFIVLESYNGVKKIDFEGNVEIIINNISSADSIEVLPDGSIVIADGSNYLVKYNSSYEEEWKISDSQIGGYVSYVDNSLWVSGYSIINKYDLDGNLIWTKESDDSYYNFLEYDNYIYGEGHNRYIAIFNKDASMKGSSYMDDYSLSNAWRWSSSYIAYTRDMIIMPNVGILVAKNSGGFKVIYDAYETSYGTISPRSTSSMDKEHYLYRSVTQCDDGGYLVGTENGQIIKFNASGELEWEKSGPYGAIVNLFSIPNDGYILLSANRITKCDINGEQEWSQTVSDITMGYIDSNGRLLVTNLSTRPNLIVYEISEAGLNEINRTSQIIPESDVNNTSRACLQIIEEANTGDYIIIERNGHIVRMDKDLNVKWNTRVTEKYDTYCGDIDTENSMVIVSGEEGYIYRIDLETGTLLDTNPTSTSYNNIFIDYNEEDGGYVISQTDGRITKYNSDFVRQGSGYRGSIIHQTIMNSNGNYVSVGPRGHIEENELVFTEASIAEEVEIVVENTKKRYNITTEVIGGNGTILGEGQAPYEEVIHGENSLNDIIATPDAGYRVLSVTVNGNPVSYIANDDGSIELEKFVNMTEDKHVVVQFSNKVSDLIVHHYIKDTDISVADDEVYTGEVGDEYTTSPRMDIEKYRLVKNEDGTYQMPNNASGIYLEDTTQVVTYYYELKPLQLIVRHLIEDSEERIIPDVISEGKEGDEYNTSPITDETILESYILSTDNLPTNANGNLIDDVTIVTYYYHERKHNITTEVDGSGGTISGEGENPYETILHKKDSVQEIKIVPDIGYAIDTITINGIEIEFVPNIETGEYILPQFESVTEDKHIVVKFRTVKEYRLNITKIDEITGEVIPGVTFNLSNKGESTNYETDENGLIKLSSLYMGIEYTLEEIKESEGYVLEDTDRINKFIVDFDENGKLKVDVTQGNLIRDIEIKERYGYYTITANLVNKPSFVLEKQGNTEEKLLANAKFVIKKISEDGSEEDAKDAEGNLIGVIENINGIDYRVVTTDNNGKIGLNLPVGNYKAIEVAAPTGYILNDNLSDRTYKFTIDYKEVLKKPTVVSNKTAIFNLNDRYGISGTSDGGFVELGEIYDETITIPANNTINNEEIVINGYSRADGVIIKYNSEGLLEYVERINSSDDNFSDNTIISYSQNASGESIALGVFTGTITIPADKTVSGTELQISTDEYIAEYIIKYDSNMKVEWIKTDELYERISDLYGDIKLYDDGSFIVRLTTDTMITIPADRTVSGDVIQVSANETQTVGIKYNDEGLIEQAIEVMSDISIGETSLSSMLSRNVQTFGIENDINNLYIYKSILTYDNYKIGVGYIYETVIIPSEYTLSGKDIVLTGDYDEFDGVIVKYDSNNKVVWAKKLNSVGDDGDLSIVEDSEQGYIVTGYFTDGIHIDALDTVSGEEIIIENEGNTPVVIQYNKDGLVNYVSILENIDTYDMWDGTIDISSAGDYFYVTDITNSRVITYQNVAIENMGVKEQVKLIVKNTPCSYNITTEVDGEGGSISGEGNDPYEEVLHGENSVKDIVCTPDNGYKIASITVNGNTIEFTPNEDGTYTLDKFTNMTEDKYIIVKYEKKDTSIIVKHVTEDGVDLVEPEIIEGKVGDTYNTEPKEFEDYEIKTIPENADGVMEEEQIEVVYVYSKVKGKVTITKVDKNNTNKVLEGATYRIEKLDKEGNIDSTFEVQEKTTGADGKVEFSELIIGKYKITEIKAPDGYELSKNNIEVEITKEQRELNIIATDVLKLKLPETGAINHMLIIMIGGLLILVSSLILKKKINARG